MKHHITEAVRSCRKALCFDSFLLAILLANFVSAAGARAQQPFVGSYAMVPSDQGEVLLFVGTFTQPVENVTVKCMNEQTGEEKFILRHVGVREGSSIEVSPAQDWFWQPGEKLVVTAPSLRQSLVFRVPPPGHPIWPEFVSFARAVGAQWCAAQQQRASGAQMPFDPNADVMAPGYNPPLATAACPYCHGRGIDPQPIPESDYFVGSSQLPRNNYCPACGTRVIATHRHGPCPRCQGSGVIRALP